MVIREDYGYENRTLKQVYIDAFKDFGDCQLKNIIADLFFFVQNT